MRRLLLVSGSSNAQLARKIASNLDVTLVDPQIVRFSNGEIFCEIQKNVRGAEVFVIQSTCHPVNDNLMELLIMLDALKRASAASITAVIPHYGYARQDRKVSPRTPISAKLVADLITVAGATRVITMDLHAGQIQGFFNIPFDNIFASPVILNHLTERFTLDNFVCVSPDAGGVERVRYFAKKLKCELAMIDKRRVAINQAKAMHVVGDVRGKDVVIIDDMIDTAGTLVEAANALKEHGAQKIIACATHGIFSGEAIRRISDCGNLHQVIVTDTVPVASSVKTDKITILSTADILSKAIHRIYNFDSVSSLFV